MPPHVSAHPRRWSGDAGRIPGTCHAGRVLVTLQVLAHEGGWDELLIVLVPIALFAVLLAIANARANRQQEQQRDADPPTDPG